MYHPKITHHLALEQHCGAYETWPLTSRVLVRGVAGAAAVPGYVLLHQFDIPDGYLLVTDCDCPFEEATSFTLLNHDMDVLATRSIGGMYCSFLLESLAWMDARTLTASFYGRDPWRIQIRPPGRFVRHWRLDARENSFPIPLDNVPVMF
jgi:hypothetical protein